MPEIVRRHRSEGFERFVINNGICSMIPKKNDIYLYVWSVGIRNTSGGLYGNHSFLWEKIDNQFDESPLLFILVDRYFQNTKRLFTVSVRSCMPSVFRRSRTI